MTGVKPKILVLTHCFPSGSSDIPGNFLIDFSRHLNSLGAEVFVLTQKMNSDYDEKFLTGSGAHISYFDWRGGNKRFAELKFSSVREIISICSLIRQGRKAYSYLIKDKAPDLILNCWVVPSGLWSFSFRKKQNTAFWALGSDISVYGSNLLLRTMIKMILSKTSNIFTNSISIRNKIVDISGKKSSLLYTARKLPKPEIKYETSSVLRLIFIGRLEKIKGPDILVSALINSDLKNYSLKIVGDGPMRQELEMSAASNSADDKIEFLGQKNASEIANLLTASDYLVISSIKESMPVVFWEAMQTSTPVLSTNVGDIEYYCEKYDVGRVCEVNERSLSELLSFVADFKPLRDNLSKNTLRIRDQISIENSAQTIFNTAQNIKNNQ